MSLNKSSLGEQRAAWRDSMVEEALWPTQRICDAHHHLWDYENDRYLAAELAADVNAGHRVQQTVFMECAWGYHTSGDPALAPAGETEFVVRQAAEVAALIGRPVITGIIGFADLCLADVRRVLEAHLEAGQGLFRGIRHAVAWDASPEIVNSHLNPPPGLLLDTQFTQGVCTLGAMGLTYDVWLFHRQLPEIIELARRAPETVIVVDHVGGPLGVGPYSGKRDEVLAYCREQLKVFANLPNARLKLGGVGMTTYGNGWHKQPQPPSSAMIANAWGDYFRWCIDTFSPQRVMFESNFPPDRRSCSYRTLWNAYKRIAEPYSQTERDWMFHDTAVGVYGL